ncbi:MAG: hypothetical protein HY314_11930 [Acidobacteria bacterium]|nr:hypothetical protein [Acidobacteriota bacterium]
MKKFLTIISVVIMAFALSGAAWAQKRSEAKKATPAKTEAKQTKKEKMKTAKGEVSAVDVSASTLTLMEKGKAVAFTFDDKTKITEAGRAVQPSAITTGTKATVTYTERDGKNWAHSIALHKPGAAKQSTPPKKTKT